MSDGYGRPFTAKELLDIVAPSSCSTEHTILAFCDPGQECEDARDDCRGCLLHYSIYTRLKESLVPSHPHKQHDISIADVIRGPSGNV